MNKLRKILTVTVFIMGAIFLYGCSREIKAKELSLLEDLSDLDIKNELNEKLNDFMDEYDVNIHDLKIVHDLTNGKNTDKYQIVVNLAVEENKEYTKEKIDIISDGLAYNINNSKDISARLSNVSINWNKEVATKDGIHYSYKLGKFNPELQNKYLDKMEK